MPHARTHMNNYRITRTPLPALLPTILAGLFILAGCGGALPIDVPIATESTDVANKTDTNPPDSILLSVGEQPPEVAAKPAPPPNTPANTPPNTPIVQVQKPEPKPEPKPKQEQVKKQVQDPAPVFEVAVAPASPPQRSFSQSQPEPQTQTETVTRSDATGQSNHDDGAITFADWTSSFSGTLPTQAETETITITSTYVYHESRTTGHQRVVYGTVYADGATEPIYAESDLAQLTPTYAEDDTAQLTPIYAEDDLAQLNPTNAIGQRILGNADTSFKDENGFLIYENAGMNILEDDTTETMADNPRVAYDAGAPVVTTVAVQLMKDGSPVLDDELNPIMVARKVIFTDTQNSHINLQAELENTLEDVTPTRTRTKVAGVKNEFLQGGAGGRLDETVCGLCISYSTNSKGELLNGKGKLLNGDGVFRAGGEARIIISGQVANRGSLNLATATFDGRKLGGKATNGVAFFRGFDDAPSSDEDGGYSHKSQSGLAHNYAGLYSGTNLGAPVPTSGPVGQWRGQLRSIGYYDFDTDFTLFVNFENTGLTIASTTNPNDKTQRFTASATYDANGVITGTVRFWTVDNAKINIGVLTGLIGADGAVGAFLSTGQSNEGDEGNGNDATVQGDKNGLLFGYGTHGYAGGFVARPGVVANTDVRIDAWTDTANFTNPLPRGVKKYTLNQEVPLNQFLLRDDPAKRPSWKKTDGGSLSLSALGGDATDGVDFFPAVITIYGGKDSATSQNYFAGLWDSTNLGAPISLSTNFNNKSSAMWKGKFSVFQGANARFDDDDFTLMVDFINNTFSATVDAGALNYYMNGSYIANGFLQGGVSRTTDSSVRNGIISGLIGSEGVVAAFVSSDNGDNRNAIQAGTGPTGYAGGFVASPHPPPPDIVDASDINYNNIPTTVAGLIYTDNPNSRFLRIENGAGLDSTGLTNPVISTQRLDDTAGSAGFGDGYVIIHSHGYPPTPAPTVYDDNPGPPPTPGERDPGYAALLPTTNLGAVRPVGLGQPTDARWNGSYSLNGNGAFAADIPITFEINFAEGTIEGTAPLANSPSDNITINTTFGANGVMRGTFSTDKVFRNNGDVYTIDATNTNVIGLIGTEGLVGIMHGNIIHGTTVTGGFVASP